MKNDWILDVLADLGAFAQKNDLPKLAARIEDASLVAAAEIASAEAGVRIASLGDVVHAGRVFRPHGESRDPG